MLSSKEEAFYQRFMELKKEAGTHSPSIFKLLKDFPEVSIKVDACFLCNPYAFDLFYEELKSIDLKKYIKFYPPQNREVAENIAAFRGLPSNRILIGNGAIELIETILGNFKNMRILLPIPTFSSYYESSEEHNHLLPYVLKKELNYHIDVDHFVKVINRENPDVVIIVNPNNPTGTILKRDDIIKIHKSLSADQTFIVDESFIDFAGNDESIENYSLSHKNIIIIRSLSKDFGVAGLRMGYSVMDSKLVDSFLKSGFLWNSNGLAYLFSELLSDKKFQKNYKKAKEDYNLARDEFYEDLLKLGLDIIPSQANFFMVKTEEDPGILFTKLLYTHGIYTRILNDKWGLEGNWLRIASKDKTENRKMIHALRKIISNE